jgi:hypothetical protein
MLIRVAERNGASVQADTGAYMRVPGRCIT